MQDFSEDLELPTFFSATPSLLSESELFKEFSINGKKFFACAISDCGKTFRFKSEMVRHSAIHSGQRPHACPVAECGKTFKRADALSNHLKIHIKKAPLQCPVPTCEAVFSSKSAIRAHMEKHKEEKVFECAYPGCGKRFTLLEQLRQHERASYYHQKFKKLISQTDNTPLSQNLVHIPEKKEKWSEKDDIDQVSSSSKHESEVGRLNAHFEEMTMVSENEKSSSPGEHVYMDEGSSPNVSEASSLGKMPETDFQDTLLSMLNYMMEENNMLKKKLNCSTDPLSNNNNCITNEVTQVQDSEPAIWQSQAKPQEQEQSDIDLFFKSSCWMDGDTFEKDMFFSDFHH